jgi:L,D-transpeptidase catalytic domain
MKKIILVIVIICTSCKIEKNNTLSYEKETIAAHKKAVTHNYNTDYFFVIEFSIHSGCKRGFLINMNNNSIEKSFLVAHGVGLGEKDGIPLDFSNNIGSNASSLGYALINGRDYSNWGVNIKYWLDGLEDSNSNLKKRVVVLHSWGGIPDENVYPNTIIQSQGCPTVSDRTMIFIDDFIQSQSNKKILILFKK